MIVLRKSPRQSKLSEIVFTERFHEETALIFEYIRNNYDDITQLLGLDLEGHAVIPWTPS